MPGRPGGRRIIPIKEKAGIKFRYIGVNPLVAHFQQAHIIWLSCQVGNINTGTLPPVVRPVPTGMTPLPGVTDENKAYFRGLRLAARLNKRALVATWKQQDKLSQLGINTAIGFSVAVFIFGSSGPVALLTNYELATAEAGLEASGVMSLSVLGSAATVGINDTRATTGGHSILHKPIKNNSFKPSVFTSFSKPCKQ